MEKLKVPPHVLESERAILGAIFLRPNLLPRIQNKIVPSDFYRGSHTKIYNAMIRLHKNGDPVDAVSVITDIKKNNELECVGGIDYIGLLIQGVSTSTGWEYHSDEIKNASVKRQLISAFAKAHHNLFGNTTTGEILSTVKSEILSIESSTEDTQTVHVSQVVPLVLESIDDGDTMGVPSGFFKLDKITMGWQGGDLIIIAGRPGMGKSVFAKDCAEHAGVPTLYFSLEMDKKQLVRRQISGISGVDHDVLRSGKLDQDQWDSVSRAAGKLLNMPIYYNDSGKMTIGKLCAIAETYKMIKGIGLVVVDYLGLIWSDMRGGTREQEVSAISRELKLLARSLDIPVICLAQLNRGCELRNPPIPVLSDLRESGAIEQDADFVAFLYRPWMYDNKKNPLEAYLFLAKGRNTRTGKIDLLFRGNNQVFQNMARGWKGESDGNE